MGKDWDAPWRNAEVVSVTDKKTNGVFYDKGFTSGVRYNKGHKEMLAFQEWFTEIAKECLRVLKPGGHFLAFGGTRTYHRLACAIEDAGFEIRDSIHWIYGSGFPKSHNISKSLDKMAGAERKVVGSRPLTGNGKTLKSGFHQPDGSGAGETIKQDVYEFTEPSTPEAQQWQGWGTALKPAHEPIVIARKPLSEKTVAQNVLKWGTGAINIDASRIPGEPIPINKLENWSGFGQEIEPDYKQEMNENGRWPANVIHDGSDEVLEAFPITKSGGGNKATKNAETFLGTGFGGTNESIWQPDEGSVARFFYCAKASKSERNAGLEGLPNFHPTVKPLALMRYLIKLVTPPNGVVLDPFLGSGTTAVAAILEGFKWVGCEMTEDYFPIIEARVEWAMNQPKPMV